MTRRILLSLPLLCLTTFATAFAPAPVYKEPPKPATSSLLRAMQGTWSRSLDTKGKGLRASRIGIEGKTWTFRSPSARGGGPVGIPYEMHLDTTRNPPTLDLFRSASARGMRGIVKIEGDRLIFCYTTSTEEDRPKAFADTETAGGRAVRTMTLTRIDPSDTSP